MRTKLAAVTKLVASIATGSLVVAGLVLAAPLAPAAADSLPAEPTTPTTVTADGLPTVQIDGVAWSQVVIDGTVYVAGQFTTARPAGAAAGTQTVARSNLLAYDLATGNLITSWAPTLDGPAYVVAASPDGTRVYVGGEFSRVNGAAQNNFTVLDRITGQRVQAFTTGSGTNGAVRAIVSSPSTIYFGGNFNTVAGNDRPRVVAVNSTTGAVTPWRVSVQSAQVQALALSPDNSRLIIGGRFEKINNIPALGSGAVSTSTGAVLPWAVNQLITDYGFDSGITSLASDGTTIFGTGFGFLNHAGGYGNLEGTFAADPMTGAVKWVEDCHGDTYSVYANPDEDSVYIAGHPYYCGNIGAFSEASPRFHHYALAFSKQDAMTITPSIHSNYFDWQGNRAPAQLAFYPDFIKGTYTGQDQAVWNVSGSGDYVVYGGEFVSINGVAQQGLVRFATSDKATNKQGPRISGSALQPVATSEAAGTAQVSWPANWDRDNETLTYEVVRDNGATPIYSTTAKSTFWQLPRLSFTDTGLVNGRAYSYKVVAKDAFGNQSISPSVSVTVAGASAGSISAYAQAVLDDNPAAYWRLGESSGSAQDWTGYADSTYGSSVTRAVTGALTGDANRAARFTGSSSSRVYGTRSSVGTNKFSVEAWFKTTSTAGGKIVGFGNSSTGNSGSYDRHVYMGADGKLRFGVYPNTVRAVTSPDAYNDGAWHHMVATLSFDGMKLYVDGALAAADPLTVSAQQSITGYWRIGGDTVGTWPGAAGDNFVGDIDDVAVYGRALSQDDVTVHYGTGTTGIVPNLAPTASFTATGGTLTAAVDASESTDPDGSIASYAWNFGDGATGSGETTSHAYAAAGTYTVTLTVTDNDGAPATTTQQVTVLSVNQLPVASFAVTPSGLAAGVDASGSTDADGTIESYAWDFGDGTTGTGIGSTHDYLEAGTYTVTLTVTDDRSGVDTATAEVTVAPLPPGYVAWDTFARNVSSGFGSTDLGGAWTNTAGATSVSGGAGVLALAGANASVGARLAGVSGTEQTTRVTESWNKRPNGSGGTLLVRGRITAGGEYRLKVGHKSGGSVTAKIVRTNTAGTETAISSEITVPGLTYTTGTAVSAVFEVTGTSPTVLRAKVWATAGTEPAAWFLDITDSTAALQVTGHTGLAGVLSSSTTNGPVSLRVDNYSVVAPGGLPTPPPDNVAPTASFEATGGTLSVAVDASASTDSDGTIASYAWNFGDGGTGTGVTASHPYAAAGTYTVTLTVTDDDGVPTVLSQQVLVLAPNQLPVASFTATPTDLTVAVDASASTDADGTIESYAWNFGDGSTATGFTASHAYASAGTYTITLTVTDDRSGTATTTRQASVGYVALDAFGRTVANGFGSADLGGAWTTTADVTSVSGGAGVLALTGANSTAGARLTGVSGTQLTTRVTQTWDKRPNGSGGTLLVRGRITTAGEYRLKVVHKSNGTVTAKIVRTNAAGTEAAISSEVTVAGLSYTAGTAVSAVFEVTGTSPTTLRAKVWAASGTEPAAWTLDNFTDSTAALQVAGHTGLAGVLSSSTTNGPVTVRVDNYSVAGIAVPPPAENQAPTASFTATPSGLSVGVDASASTDSDGTIASYAWNFGDGGTGTGVTTSHPYTAAGTYTVTLTVTDDDGAPATTTRQVTVAASNQAPTASFTATPSGLSVEVDASASTDPDGTIASYAWNFGDGGTGTGVTTSHPYTTAGTYTVTLTVTDDDDAPATTTRQVSVTTDPPANLASDAFERSVASGFGSADVGGAWSTTAGAASVAGGAGVLTLAAKSSTAGARLPDVTGTSLRTQVTESWDKRPTGSGGSFLLRGRITTGGEYRLKVAHTSTGALKARLVRTNAAGAETALGLTGEITVPGVTYAAGTSTTALIEVVGTSPTTVRVKVWAAGQPEPAAWLISETDATAELQGPGHTGVAAVLSSSVTNAPVAVRVDNYTVTAVP